AARLPNALRALGKLLHNAERDFKLYQRTRSVSGRLKVRRIIGRNLIKAVALVEEISPRTEELDSWFLDLRRLLQEMNSLEEGASHGGRSVADRTRRLRCIKDLRDRCLAAQITVEELRVLVRVVRKRQRTFQQARSELAEANLRLV